MKLSIGLICLALSIPAFSASAQQMPPGAVRFKPVPLATSITCGFAHGNGENVDMNVAANSGLARLGENTMTREAVLGEFRITLESHSGPESGIELTIRLDERMLQRTWWSGRTGLSRAGAQTGLVYLVEDKDARGGAKLQYSCASQ